MVMLCDGRMVCGCSDPYAKRVLGDARKETVAGIWTGERASALRRDLNAGGSTFCGDCALKLPLAGDQAPPQRPLDVPSLPSRLYIECTAACNISCAQACCAPETGITRTRQAGMLDFDLFTRVVDEAGPSLGRIDFFNYGEAFLHKRAVEMCEYIKTKFPHIYLYTSTNGLAFTEDSVRRLVHSGIDEVTFSIDGATPGELRDVPEARRLRKGDSDTCSAAAGEKQRAARDVPFINWRYILFTHNDSEAEMQLARTMAAEMGVDRLCWELTDHPEDMFSRRFVRGSAELEAVRHEIWDDNNLGNAIPGATPRAEINVRGPIPGLPVVGRPGRPISLITTVRNASTRPFPAQASYGRRLVRLGAQLCRRDGQVVNRDFERAWLPSTLQPGATVQVPMTITAPDKPGRYALKFDLVSEGIDWFEACGSPTTMRTLVVI